MKKLIPAIKYIYYLSEIFKCSSMGIINDDNEYQITLSAISDTETFIQLVFVENEREHDSIIFGFPVRTTVYIADLVPKNMRDIFFVLTGWLMDTDGSIREWDINVTRI